MIATAEKLIEHWLPAGPHSYTKDEVRAAIEELFEGRVVAVRTQKRQGKPRRHKNRQGHTKSWKKAVVKLHEEDHITFF